MKTGAKKLVKKAVDKHRFHEFNKFSPLQEPPVSNHLEQKSPKQPTNRMKHNECLKQAKPTQAAIVSYHSSKPRKIQQQNLSPKGLQASKVKQAHDSSAVDQLKRLVRQNKELRRVKSDEKFTNYLTLISNFEQQHKKSPVKEQQSSLKDILNSKYQPLPSVYNYQNPSASRIKLIQGKPDKQIQSYEKTNEKNHSISKSHKSPTQKPFSTHSREMDQQQTTKSYQELLQKQQLIQANFIQLQDKYNQMLQTVQNQTFKYQQNKQKLLHLKTHHFQHQNLLETLRNQYFSLKPESIHQNNIKNQPKMVESSVQTEVSTCNYSKYLQVPHPPKTHMIKGSQNIENRKSQNFLVSKIQKSLLNQQNQEQIQYEIDKIHQKVYEHNRMLSQSIQRQKKILQSQTLANLFAKETYLNAKQASLKIKQTKLNQSRNDISKGKSNQTQGKKYRTQLSWFKASKNHHQKKQIDQANSLNSQSKRHSIHSQKYLKSCNSDKSAINNLEEHIEGEKSRISANKNQNSFLSSSSLKKNYTKFKNLSETNQKKYHQLNQLKILNIQSSIIQRPDLNPRQSQKETPRLNKYASFEEENQPKSSSKFSPSEFNIVTGQKQENLKNSRLSEKSIKSVRRDLFGSKKVDQREKQKMQRSEYLSKFRKEIRKEINSKKQDEEMIEKEKNEFLSEDQYKETFGVGEKFDMENQQNVKMEHLQKQRKKIGMNKKSEEFIEKMVQKRENREEKDGESGESGIYKYQSRKPISPSSGLSKYRFKPSIRIG